MKAAVPLAIVRRALYATAVTVVTFFLHRSLRRAYYHRCDYDIIQVLFFKNSNMCTFLSGVIDVIEGEYFTLLRGACSWMAPPLAT